MTPLVLYTTAARTQIIPPRPFGLHWKDDVFRLIEIHRPRGLSHSRSVFINVSVFFRSPCRYVDCERLRPVVGCLSGKHVPMTWAEPHGAAMHGCSILTIFRL